MIAARDLDARHLISTAAPSRFERQLALIIIAISAMIFAIAVPFAKTPLARAPAFVAAYQSALAVNDLITAVLILLQFKLAQSRAVLAVASAYLFTAILAVLHQLTFPGLFAETGLLGAGPQTTVWLYMLWHGVFPLLLIAYASTKGGPGDHADPRSSSGAIAGAVLATAIAAAVVGLIATAGHDLLPVLLGDGRYTATMDGVVTSVWLLSLAALLVLWLRKPHTVLDLWLMVVLCVWICEIGLSAILNAARFDLGFYLGRIYGLAAASVVLVVLLFETGALQAQLMRLIEATRRQAESDRARLADQESLFAATVESSIDAIVVQSLDGTILGWNAAAEQLSGYAAKQAIGKNIALIVPADRHVEVRRILERIALGAQIKHFETVRLRKDGSEVPVSLSVSPIRSATGEIVGASTIARDLTEWNARESQYRQAQKMEAIGQLTGGVAHDFNNILTVITGTIEILAEGVADKPELAAITTMIDEAAQRGADLTRHLLAFARKQPLEPRETDVNALVVAAGKLLRPTLGEQIEIHTTLADKPWVAFVDPNQLTTAILNLALNARDAMPNGGKLTIETGNVELDEAYGALNSEVKAGPYVLVAISDTGSGIPPDLLEKVFEPFFTTKETGKGTGLGLSMVYGFVKQSGGHVKIYSEQALGTTVKLYLPRGAQKAGVAAEPAPIERLQRGTEVVLVVEDDELVRSYVVAQVRSLGYHTLAAAGSAQALEILRGNGEIDLLFTDVIMPGAMNGPRLVAEALKARPHIGVLYTSGYTENAIVHHGRLDPGVLLLAKPYRKADLARLLRQALEATPASAAE